MTSIQTTIFLFVSMIYPIAIGVSYLDCSSFTTATDCKAYASEGCFWVSHHVDECIPIHCNDFSSDRQSCLYEYNHNCRWQPLPHTNSAICYEHCPKLFDIVFILNIKDTKDVPNALNYTKSLITLFNITYGGDSAHFGLVLFSIINPVIVFDLNTGWDVDRYLSALDIAFDLSGRNSLLFNADRANASKAILTAKRNVFETSNRWQMSNAEVRKIAIFISAQDYDDIEAICSYTKAFTFDTDDISFYGAQIGINGSFNCFGSAFEFINTDLHPIVSYSDLYDDFGYLLSSLCPHTLIPTVSPTSDPTTHPTDSPTSAWRKVSITNHTCTTPFRFHLPFDGIVSGTSLVYTNGSRDGYWGNTQLNQFGVFVMDYATQSPVYPLFGSTRGVIRCSEKYAHYPPNIRNTLLDFYYCFDDDDASVNDTELILYGPSYSVTANDEWSVIYVNQLLNAFRQRQRDDTICFAVYVLYDVIYTAAPTRAPTAITTTRAPSLHPTQTVMPSVSPTNVPSSNPLVVTSSAAPISTLHPHRALTMNPTMYPTLKPSIEPSMIPSELPTNTPSLNPSAMPSISPSSLHHVSSCCEWFAPKIMRNMKCSVGTLTQMKRYSDYLITNKAQCMSASNCGYSAYLQVYNGDRNAYNECMEYWMKIVTFKMTCVTMDAYDVYTQDEANTCYLCLNYEVIYDDADPDSNGRCDGPTSQTESDETSVSPSAYPTQGPSRNATTNPTLFPLVNTTELPLPSEESATHNDHSIIIHYSATEDASQSHDISSTNGCDVIIECDADRTETLCMFVVLSCAVASAFVMWTIRSYYQWNFGGKDTASYSYDSSVFRAVGYVRQLSDRSDVEQMQKKKKKKKDVAMDKEKEKANKKKKRKRKKKALERKRKEDIKMKILAAISDSDPA
eukprot:63731_1